MFSEAAEETSKNHDNVIRVIWHCGKCRIRIKVPELYGSSVLHHSSRLSRVYAKGGGMKNNIIYLVKIIHSSKPVPSDQGSSHGRKFILLHSCIWSQQRVLFEYFILKNKEHVLLNNKL